VFAGEGKKGGHLVGTMCRSFVDRRAKAEFVEEVQQEGHMGRALVFRWRVRVGENCKALPSGAKP
jgi:hypothetical protein